MSQFNNLTAMSRLRSQALACCSALAIVGGAAPAFAQDSAAAGVSEPEAIVVTGIRSSLRSAAGIKKNSLAIVDAISSEDLGKFPDTNVAESLQRIPGVSIDRSNGEGRFVTVRGFGPAFNTVLVNGRTFASDNQGREFSFDLLAAELISGAEVYKSSQARLQDGGIGATLNIKTPRPLDLGGFKAVVSAKGQYERNSDKVTPQGFGLISDTFADGKFGLLASVSYQKRDAQTRYTQNRGYIPGTTVGTGANAITNVFAPRNQDVGQDDQSRERIGFTGTAQYRPNDQLTFTVDGLYNQFNVDSRVQALGSWFEPSSYTAAAIDSNRTVTSLTTNGNADLIQTSNNRYVKTYALGGNVEWKPNSQLTVKADVSWSRAKDSAGGRNYFTVIGIPSTYSFQQATGNGFPSTTGYTADLTNAALGRSHIALRQGNSEAERVLEYKLDTEWKSDGGALDAIRLGFVNTNRSKNSQSIATDPNTLCLYCGYNEPASAALLSKLTLRAPSGTGSVPTNILGYDADAYFKFLESPAQAAARDQARGLPAGTTAALLAATNGFAATVQPNSFAVSEKVFAGYLEADLKGNLGAMPWTVNLGARYVHTEITASGRQLALTDLLAVPNDPTIYQAVFANGGVPVSTAQRSSYDYFLPNINVKVNLTDKWIVRVSASRTLTRPQIRDLAPRTNFDVTRPASLDASGGNPNLRPYTANNFDVSLEWYPTSTTTLSVAGYYKSIDNFIVQTRSAENFTIANASGLPIGGGITGPTTATFNVRRPRNSENVSVRGVELNVTHTFDYLPAPLDGLGLSANATFVDSSAAFDVTRFDQSVAVEGLGNSYNLTGFYEKDGFAARVAYNRRGRFLEYLVTPGQGGDPVFRRPYSQVDVRVSYDIKKFAQVFAEGTNVTNAKNITTGRFNNQVLDYVDTGARYAAGVRLNF
ncbi:TonB-dependent receptor [Novosphingobium sediminis]|uniref:TonB-dependent receptor n=2 Tax=Novosphingobium sediminis TaxID=707214 RepID=A0A512APS7_9SPHN|nr:TonB-dependent receptor [Novosphingobium sediminis]